LNVTGLKNISMLEPFSADLVKTLKAIHPGTKSLVKVEDEGETLTLAIFATEFRLRDRLITLVSMQNIESELAEHEMAAWQKLIRVLTHEIMNSVTPIASLASTANDLITKSDKTQADDTLELGGETKGDIRDALATIEKRSEGLLHFINAYRDLTRIPKPEFEIFPVSELLSRVIQLMKDQISKNDVELITEIEPEGLELTADSELIEQVLINLILNAIQALKGSANGQIRLRSFLDKRGWVAIVVADNGPGIKDDFREKIFTPFFTTKKDGSGIGLSLSRQIMRLHRGNISMHSIPNEITSFTLRF
jgi:signal transduction histidine kinase